MILTHGANSLNRGGGDDLLYLTYFNDFDLATKKDTPIKGPEIQFQTQYTFTKITMNCMGTTVPALKAYQNGGTLDLDPVDGIEIPNSINVVSIEAFIYAPYKSASMGAAFKIGSVIQFGCDPQGWGSGFYGGMGNATDIQVFNGAIIRTDQYGKYISFPSTAIFTSIRHVAQVINYTSREIKVYIDGILYCKYVYIIDIPVIQKIAAKPRGSWEGIITQAAIFGKDKSINDEMNYPVPTSPYDPSVIVQ